MKTLTAEQRQRAIAAGCSASAPIVGEVLAFRVGGVELDQAKRTTLLAAAVAREIVELEVDLLSYEQKTGERNRKYFRFRDGAMMSIGKTGSRTPFLRDHEKWDVRAISGRVATSQSKKLDDGHYQILQTVVLTEPESVERALRGNLFAVSIGANPTGPVLCSHCETEVFEDCWHFPGQELQLDSGEKHVVEWIYTEAELIETSEVPIGAVRNAGPQSIRAAIEAAIGAAPEGARELPRKNETMSKLSPAALAKLGLAATASEEEVTAAVEKLHGDAAAAAKAKQDLAILQLEQKINGQSPADLFIKAALDTGRIKPVEEANWRELFQLSPDRARTLMEQRAPQAATPVGGQRQSDTKDADDHAVAAAATGGDAKLAKRDAKANEVLKANGVDPAQAAKFAAKFGAKDPKAAIAKHACGVEEN